MISRCLTPQKSAKIRADRVVTAEFKSTEALGSQNSPQLSFLVCGLGTKPSPTISRAFIFGHCNRAPPKARRQMYKLQVQRLNRCNAEPTGRKLAVFVLMPELRLR